MKKVFLSVLTAMLMAACQESLENKCEREAKEYTKKNCPAVIAQDIVIDSLTFERTTHTLHYYYRLTGQSDREEALNKEEARKVLKDGLKNATSLKTYKDEGYTFAYTYRSEKDPKKIWFETKLTKDDY